MRCHSKDSLSATTEVKVLSPEIILIALGQGFHFLEANIRRLVKGESDSGVPGSKSVADKRTVYIGTWENQIAPKEAFKEWKKMTREYGGLVVGLTHSRGVNSVMAIESCSKGTLEGVSSLTQREEVSSAIH